MELLASNFDQSRFFRAEGYKHKQDKKFRIKEVTSEELEESGKPVKKLVVWFTNSDQGLILNKTNLRTLQGAFGDNTVGWKDKIIVIYPTMAPLRGKMVPALRVRIPPPKPAPAPQQPVTPGNGAAIPAAAPVAAAAPLAAAAPPAAVDPELEPDQVKPIDEDLDDEVVF